MSEFEKFQFFDEEGRQEIYRWSEQRRQKYRGFRRNIYFLRIFAFDRGLLKSFVYNINVIVIVQMILAGGITFLCQYTGIRFEVHPTLFVSPLIFPLAFSINTDFQRREKVLEDLANFKGSAMVYFFCLRDWRESADFDENFIKAASNKLKSLLFHLREYLMTEKLKRRSFILKVIYEDCSDLAQIIERVRLSKLPTNSPLISRLAHLLTTLCYSFERLRVVREYRSPRSIRSFTKVFIFGLPILLSPYYVFLGETNNNKWSPYFIAVLVSFVFGSLQAVQDKLDDPFDGMSEDDIDLARLDDWTVQSLEATANRTFKIGRFTVLVKDQGKVEVNHPPQGGVGAAAAIQALRHTGSKTGSVKSELNRMSSFQKEQQRRRQMRLHSQVYSDDDTSLRSEDMDMHPYAGVLSKLPGNATILRGGQVKEYRSMSSMDRIDTPTLSGDKEKDGRQANSSGYTTPTSTQRSVNGRTRIAFNQVLFGDDHAQITIRNTMTGTEITPVNGSVKESSVDPPPSLMELFDRNTNAGMAPELYNDVDTAFMQLTPSTNLINNISESSSLDKLDDGSAAYTGKGVASYINAAKRNAQKHSMTRNSSEPMIAELNDTMYRNASVPSNLSDMKSRSRVYSGETESGATRFAVNKTTVETPLSPLHSASADFKDELDRTSSTARLVSSGSSLTQSPNTVPVENRRNKLAKSRTHHRTGSDSSLFRRISHDSLCGIARELKDSEVFI